MQPPRLTDDRPRCAWHGLVVNNDGACALCAVDDRSAGRSHWREVILVVASVGAAAAVVAVLLWPIPPQPNPAATTLDGVPIADVSGSDRPVHAPPIRTKEPPAAAGAMAPPEGLLRAPVSAEDRRLGEPPLQLPAARAAPAAPPRASVDPEPQPPDDPRDFDVSLRGGANTRP
jgi:hypothetical protein